MVRKRRKSRKPKRGIYISKKCINPIHYRSSWERTCCEWFDWSDEIISYEYESVTIPYISNIKTKKIRLYYPDFLVTYKDGSKKLIEVKRKDKLVDLKVIKKMKAAQEWVKNQQPPMIYELWTNLIIESLQKINQMNLLGNIIPAKPQLLSKKKKIIKKTNPRLKRKKKLIMIK